MSALDLAELTRRQALALAIRDLRITDLEAKVADLATGNPEFEGFKREMDTLNAELAAMRAAGADTDRAFLEETGALHEANKVIRSELEDCRAERDALEQALIAESTAFAADREAMAAQIQELTRERDALDREGQELAGEYRATVALLEEERAAANTPPQVFEARGVNGSTRVFLTAYAEEATAPPAV